ncbi:MAG: zinc-dependent alcohol dehydrogenase [Actinomycetes bacterium]
MRALVADLSSLPRVVWSAAGSRVRHDLPWRRGGVLRLRHDLPEPVLPAAGWVRVTPLLSGVCGSDMKLLHAGFSPVLSAYNPGTVAVPGHETVGVVTAAAAGVTRVGEGDRVVLDPVTGCVAKGLPPCRRCAAGEYHVCQRLADAGVASVGQGQGFSDSLGGGWADALVAHESQCHPVGSAVADERAVLAEPAAVALHAALRWERAGDTVTVIGPGTIGLLVTATLRRLHPDLDIVVVCAGEFGARRALAAGASRTVAQPSASVLEAVAAHVGARRLKPRIGRLPVLDGGVDAVFDCIGSAETIDLGLRLLRPRGTFVLVGTAGRARVDWSLVWFRELTLRGSICYAEEPSLGGRRAFAEVVDWLGDPSYAVDGLVTHTFGLDRYGEALDAAARGPGVGAVKVTFRP